MLGFTAGAATVRMSASAQEDLRKRIEDLSYVLTPEEANAVDQALEEARAEIYRAYFGSTR